MKQQLLTTIQQAFPGKHFVGDPENYSGSIEPSVWAYIGFLDNGNLYINIEDELRFSGPIPLENGEPDWEFIRKILVNWRSF